MRIKQLELQGFKSFVDPTVIDFDLPIVGVVGPNGCGKSNVVDAIRWVMGEMSAKHLRGKSMEDVIFSGSSNRAPLGLASVSLTFCTEDGMVPPLYSGFSEITVTRRLYRSGESDYMINKVPCRLRDILDLFLGTGAGTKAYSVIAQGQVDFAINAKPEDRRRLIEEAAGISKFKSRRDAATRRMEATQNNLLRLGDILAEIRRQIRSLERQVKKAERYNRYRSELRELDFYLSSKNFLEKQREQGEMVDLLQQWTGKEGSAQTSLATLETDLEKERLELTEKESELSRFQEQIFEVSNRLQLARTQQEYKEREGTTLQEQSARWKQESDEARERIRIVDEDLTARQANAGSFEEMTQQAQEVLATAEAIWQSTQTERQAKVELLEECREKITSYGQSLATLESRYHAAQQQLPSLENRLAQTEGEQNKLKGQIDEATRSIQEAEATLSGLTSQHATMQQHRKELETKYNDGNRIREEKQYELTTIQEELVNKRSRLRSLVELEKSLEGYGEGVRSILKTRRGKGIHGLVADAIEATPEYEAALVASLGEKLQYVIVESHEQGLEAIEFLKKEAGGRSNFLPKEVKAQSQSFPDSGTGVIGPLRRFVKLKPEFEQLGDYLFGDVLLVEDLETAIGLWECGHQSQRYVTLSGDRMDPSGVIAGGRPGKGASNVLAKRREIEELRREVVRLEQEIGLKDDSVSQLEGTLSGIELERKALEQEWQTIEVNKAKLEQDVSHRKDMDRRFGEQLAALQANISELNKEISDNTKSQAELELKQTDNKQQATEQQARLFEIQQEVRSADEQVTLKHETLTEAKVRMSSVQERVQAYRADLERLEGTKQELNERIESRTQEIQEASDKVTQLKQDLEALAEQLIRETVTSDDLKKQQAEIQEVFNRKRTSLQEHELKVREFRKQLDLAKEHTADLKISLTRIEGEVNYLTGQMSEKYSVTLPDIAPEWHDKAPECEDPDIRAKELREKIDKLGPINMEAIPEFAGLQEREVFLSEQYADLEISIENLHKVIRKINQTTRQRFEETFKLVQEKFTQVFPRLFKGGHAELRLEDPNDMLNTGVQLMVQPPGKRLSHISLLSGGEKALSAVAFIFSIFLVKPSPFCILDEVDAPLDDANTGRFHKLIQDMTDRTQFILITHNKLTMGICNGLYGVTMQEPGVSKIVSVHLDKVEDIPQAATA